MRFTDAARRVIDLGWAIWDYYEREGPKRHPRYPLVFPGEGEVPPPLEEDELRTFLGGLPAEYVYRLVTLLNLGRERFRADEFEAHVPDARAEFPDPAGAIEMLVGLGSLPMLGADGLMFAAQAGTDLDAPAGVAA